MKKKTLTLAGLSLLILNAVHANEGVVPKEVSIAANTKALGVCHTQCEDAFAGQDLAHCNKACDHGSHGFNSYMKGPHSMIPVSISDDASVEAYQWCDALCGESFTNIAYNKCHTACQDGRDTYIEYKKVHFSK